MTSDNLKKDLKNISSKEYIDTLQRFFKTGLGQYGEGDIFIGVRIPQVRSIIKNYYNLPLPEIEKLMQDPIHEIRQAGLLILVHLAKLAKKENNEKNLKRICSLYLKNKNFINNWDLVDLTAEHISGEYYYNNSKDPLYKLLSSKKLFHRRIALLSTFNYIKKNDFKETLKMAEILLNDKEDLMHKASGWMLREIGKRDVKVLEKFLKTHYKVMPRTMLRYSIERFPEEKRQEYLKGKRDV